MQFKWNVTLFNCCLKTGFFCNFFDYNFLNDDICLVLEEKKHVERWAVEKPSLLKKYFSLEHDSFHFKS